MYPQKWINITFGYDVVEEREYFYIFSFIFCFRLQTETARLPTLRLCRNKKPCWEQNEMYGDLMTFLVLLLEESSCPYDRVLSIISRVQSLSLRSEMLHNKLHENVLCVRATFPWQMTFYFDWTLWMSHNYTLLLDRRRLFSSNSALPEVQHGFKNLSCSVSKDRRKKTFPLHRSVAT